MVSVSHMTSEEHAIKRTCDFVGKSPLSHHPANFGGHNRCGGWDMTVLVCHVILEDRVNKESCDFMGGSPSW